MRDVNLPEDHSSACPATPLVTSPGDIDKRLRRAEAQRDRLLHRIGKRQAEIHWLQGESTHQRTDVSQALATSLAARQRTVGLLHEALSRCLESTGSLSAKQQAQLRRTYGPVLREVALDLSLEAEHAFEKSRKPPEVPGPSPRTTGPERPSPQELKSIYLNLVATLHPDLEPDEQRRNERTEVLKEVNRAYATHDAALLLQLRRTWSPVPFSNPVPAVRLAECEEYNRQLLKQLRALTAQRKPLRQASAQVPLALSHLQAQQRTLDALLSATRQFLCGSIDVEHFIALAPALWTCDSD